MAGGDGDWGPGRGRLISICAVCEYPGFVASSARISSAQDAFFCVCIAGMLPVSINYLA